MADNAVMDRQTTPQSTDTERASERPVFTPRVDIYEADDHFVLEADMPGVAEDSIDIVVEKKTLTIHGRVPEEQLSGYRLRYSEYGIGDYYRSFTLTDDVDDEKIEASVKQGALYLKLPKKAPVSRRIAVKSG